MGAQSPNLLALVTKQLSKKWNVKRDKEKKESLSQPPCLGNASEGFRSYPRSPPRAEPDY